MFDIVPLFLWFIMISRSFTASSTTAVNPLNGQHLRVLTMEFPGVLVAQRNATGHVISIGGPQKHLMAALSQKLNFSYSFLPIAAPYSEDDSPTTRGFLSYLVADETDYVLATILATPSRFKKADLPFSFFYGSFSTLIPYPGETLDLTASFKPLSYKVWILVAVAALTTVAYLTIFHSKEKNISNSESTVVLYVLGNLVSQGQNYLFERLATRIATGAWCCGCFFLVQIYCCTLISHITSPNQKPLVNFFLEIADTPGVGLTYDKGFAMSNVLLTSDSVHIKRFVNILKKDDRLTPCNTTNNCMERVRSGKFAYSAPVNILNSIMAADFKTGTCHFTRTKETFWGSHVYTLLRKNSPYTEAMSRAILRFRETGLSAVWETMYLPSPTKCLNLNQRIKSPRLSMKHLSSSFVILIAGYLISLLAYVTGKLFFFSRFLLFT